MNGADVLVQTLVSNSIDICFANVGSTEVYILQALERHPEIRCIPGLCEGTLTGAADGYSRMTGKTAATLLHLGPGLAYGAANLHNGKKARSSILNIVGQDSTTHQKYETPLRCDVEGVARPFSHWVKSVTASCYVQGDTMEAIHHSRMGAGKVSTLILPSDASWSEAQMIPMAPLPNHQATVDEKSLAAAVQALKAGKRCTLFLGGKILRSKPLEVAAQIASKFNIKLMTSYGNARTEVGAGRVHLPRIPYFLSQAVPFMADTEVLILLGAWVPVPYLGYKNQPSEIVSSNCQVISLATPDDDPSTALHRLADECGATNTQIAASFISQRSTDFKYAATGPLTADAVMQIVCKYLPKNAILCDESVTSGLTLGQYTKQAEPHDFLQQTGAAIGFAMPASLGAAVACPDRKVICLVGDGCGMFNPQSLWTYARENLNILVIVLANGVYKVIQKELEAIDDGDSRSPVAKHLLSLGNPTIKWTELANSLGVSSDRANSIEKFEQVFSGAVTRSGPFLIEAVV